MVTNNINAKKHAFKLGLETSFFGLSQVAMSEKF